MTNFRVIVTIVVLLLTVSHASAQIPPYIPQNGLVAWWPFNGNSADESIGNNDGTVNGATPTLDRFGTPNSAYDFDGVNDNITFPNAINFGANSFTVSVYCNVRSWNMQEETYIFGSPFTAGTNDQGFRIGTAMNNGQEAFQAAIGDIGGDPYYVYSQQKVYANRWYYLTMVYDRDASTLTLYMNGQFAGMTPVAPNFGNTDLGKPPTAGSFRMEAMNAQFFSGKIDDIAVWNRALTPQEIATTYYACAFSVVTEPSNQTVDEGTAATLSVITTEPASVIYRWQKNSNGTFTEVSDPSLYANPWTSTLTINTVNAQTTGTYRCEMTLNACVVYSKEVEVSSSQPSLPSYIPTDGLVGWWPFNGNANDESGNGNDGTVSGAALTTDRFGAASSSYTFDGVNDVIETPNQTLTGSVSFSAWYKMSSFNTPGNDMFFVSNQSTSQNIYSANIAFGFRSYQGEYGHSTYVQSPLTGYYATNNLPSTDVWHHIVCVFEDGAYVKMYLDSVLIYENTNVISNPSQVSLPLLIGGTGTSSYYYFDGELDDVGLWNRALTASEIRSLYTGQACNALITSHPRSVRVSEATQTSLEVSASSDTVLSYRWQFNDGSGFADVSNGATYAGVATSSLLIVSMSTATQGDYRCIVSTSRCSLTSESASVTLKNSGIADTTSICINNPGMPNPWPYPTAANGGYISLGNMGTQQQFSVSLWVKPSATQNPISILLDCSHGGSLNWVIQSLNSGSTWTWINNEFTLTPDVWQHLLCTYENGTSRVFVNGVLVDQASLVIQWSGTQNLYLGNWPEGGRRFNGMVDELLVTNTVLYSQDFFPLQTLREADVPSASLGLWHFDEGNGSTTANELTAATTAINNWTWSTRTLSNCDIGITSQPTSPTVYGGHEAMLSVTATAPSAITYKWQRKLGDVFIDIEDGSDYSGSDTDTLTISSARISARGPYRCVLTESECSVTSDEVTLQVDCPCNAE